MSFYLSSITICGQTVINGGIRPPSDAKDGEYFLQSPPALNSVWVKRHSRWISAGSSGHSESILLYPEPTALVAQVNLLPVRQSDSGYGLYLAESSFVGSTASNNNATDCWRFQLSCEGVDVGIAVSTAGFRAGINSTARQNLLVGLQPSDGLLLQLSIAQIGNPGAIDGVFSLSYNLLYPNG